VRDTKPGDFQTFAVSRYRRFQPPLCRALRGRHLQVSVLHLATGPWSRSCAHPRTKGVGGHAGGQCV